MRTGVCHSFHKLGHGFVGPSGVSGEANKGQQGPPAWVLFPLHIVFGTIHLLAAAELMVVASASTARVPHFLTSDHAAGDLLS